MVQFARAVGMVVALTAGVTAAFVMIASGVALIVYGLSMVT
jgi:hypothetical protein